MMNKALSFDFANYGDFFVYFNPGWVRAILGLVAFVFAILNITFLYR